MDEQGEKTFNIDQVFNLGDNQLVQEQRQSTYGHDAAMQQYAQQALSVVQGHLDSLKNNGMAADAAMRALENVRSVSDRMADGETGENLPHMEGFGYLNHLFRRTANRARKRQMKNRGRGPRMPDNIYTDQMEALKVALQAMGVYSEKNPGGMPIDIKAAKQIWFGDNDIDEIAEAEWRTGIELGDRKIDPKKIRKFVNYDGSLTWEILNEDKTVMSRFTMGEFGGTKVFAQGGYGKFAELLEKVKTKAGPEGGFDEMRGALTGA